MAKDKSKHIELLKNTRKFVVFDLETTGFSPEKGDKIIEIGAVKIYDDEIIDEFSVLINPEINIPKHITAITGINTGMIKNKQSYTEVLPDFCDFIEDIPLAAHNASFDMKFLNFYLSNINMPIKTRYLDTIAITKYFYPNLKNYQLKTVHEFFGLTDFTHHRALDDSMVTAKILIKIQEEHGLLGKGNSILFDNEKIIKLRNKYLSDFDV